MSLIVCCTPEASGASMSLQPIADPKEVPFRFRDLPLELRGMVYEYALTFRSIDKYFKEYMEKKCANDEFEAPDVKMACPSILLVSKDITNEALPRLYSAPLVLSYGIMGAHLQSLISPVLLRKLRHVKISDAGCRHLDSPPAATFTGYCYAAVEFCTLVRPGHSLLSVSIEFKSQYVKHHLQNCLGTKQNCGINSWVSNMMRYLKELHNVDKITLDMNIPTATKDDVINTMKAPPCSFLALPYHVRQKIYGYAVDYNDGTKAMRRATKALAFNIDPPAPVKTTPTMLLINKQITGEVANVLFSRPLVVSNLFPVVNNALVNLNDFITLAIFQRATRIEIRINDFRYLNMLVDIATQVQDRRFKMHTLHIHFEEPRQKRLILEQGEYYPDHSVWSCLRPLNALIHVSKEIIITGGLPACFTEPFIYNTTQRTENDVLRPLMVRNNDNHEVDVRSLRLRPFSKQYRLG